MALTVTYLYVHEYLWSPGIGSSCISPYVVVEFPSTLLLKVNNYIIDNAASHIFRHHSMSDLILCSLLWFHCGE